MGKISGIERKEKVNNNKLGKKIEKRRILESIKLLTEIRRTSQKKGRRGEKNLILKNTWKKKKGTRPDTRWRDEIIGKEGTL